MKRWQAWSQSLQIVVTTLQLEVSVCKMSLEGFGNCLCGVKILLLVLFMKMLSYMSESGGKLFALQNVHDTCTNTNFKEDIGKYFRWIFFPCFCYQKDYIRNRSVKKASYLPITGLAYFTRGEKL